MPILHWLTRDDDPEHSLLFGLQIDVGSTPRRSVDILMTAGSIAMSDHDAFERILTSLHEAMLDDVHWPITTALIDEACGRTSNALLVCEGPKDDLRVLFVGLYYRGQRREDLEREYLEVYHPIDERVPRLRQLPDPRAPAARCPAPAKGRCHVPNNMGQCPILIQVFFPYAPRSCDGMESRFVQAEARVHMPLTRSSGPRSVPTRCMRRATRGQRLQRCCATVGAGPARRRETGPGHAAPPPTIRVSLHESGRIQRVHVSRDEDRYVFRSVVLLASEVTRKRRPLAPHRLSSVAAECLQGTGDVRIR